MTVHVAGNCQAGALATTLRAMNPALDVRAHAAIDARVVAPGDIVFWQRPRTAEASSPPVEHAYVFPALHFPAYHPDLVRARTKAGLVQSPLRFCNSSLVLYGWLRALPVDETVRLFCEPVYDRLGFFDRWNRAKASLLRTAEAAGLPLDADFASWTRAGCFMHIDFHPKLSVFGDIARALAARAGLAVPFPRVESYFADPLLDGPVWPVYPEIAARLGVGGGFAFKPPVQPDRPAVPLDLEAFVAASYAGYAKQPMGDLACPRLDDPAYRDLEVHARRRHAPPHRTPPAERGAASPYAALPDERFWRRAVAGVPAAGVDPLGVARLPVRRGTRIATAGSCFAQHLGASLTAGGYTFYRTEAGGPFSTLSGNVYTARQLLQLFDRAFGTFVPRDVAWRRDDGRYVDPFRPRARPDGFAAAEDVEAAREVHFARVREMFERLDTFMFTLGQTEAWRAEDDGATFPLAPGVDAAGRDGAAYAFHNDGVRDVAADLDAFLRRLRDVNPGARTIVSVSPVPLVATFEPRHVLVSSTASKAILRAAVDEVARAHRAVAYFPAYEIVTGPANRGAYWDRDLRSVTPAGVDHVMRVFFAHCEDAESVAEAEPVDVLWEESLFDCDEERLDTRPAAHVAAR